MNQTDSLDQVDGDEASADASASTRSSFYLALAAGTVLVVLALNGAWLLWRGRPEPIEPPPRVGSLLGKQVAAVRDGQSDTIHVVDAVIYDHELEPLRELEGLRTLKLDAGEITDAGMGTIGAIGNLTHLRLRNSPITDAGIEALGPHENLRVLNLPQAELSVEGVAKLATVPRLRQLRLGGTRHGDLSRGVAQLPQLRAVHLINVPVTDAGLKQIASLPYLESLYLDGAAVTEAGWLWLFEHHPELHVHINQQHHDRDPARHPHRDDDG